MDDTLHTAVYRSALSVYTFLESYRQGFRLYFVLYYYYSPSVVAIMILFCGVFVVRNFSHLALRLNLCTYTTVGGRCTYIIAGIQ